jgi:hypothetical protein
MLNCVCQKMEQNAFVNSKICTNQTFYLIKIPILLTHSRGAVMLELYIQFEHLKFYLGFKWLEINLHETAKIFVL